MRRLKKWVKVVLIIMILAISTLIYFKTGYLKNEFLLLTAWTWLLIGQFITIYFIVEN